MLWVQALDCFPHILKFVKRIQQKTWSIPWPIIFQIAKLKFSNVHWLPQSQPQHCNNSTIGFVSCCLLHSNLHSRESTTGDRLPSNQWCISLSLSLSLCILFYLLPLISLSILVSLKAMFITLFSLQRTLPHSQ